MKSVVDGFFAALALYSVLPVPMGRWNKDNMRYALCFFPIVGVFISVILLLWYEVCLRFSLSAGLFAAVATLLPLAVSGGIHLDGFIDTADALSSHAVRERKLEILQDPHVGAFGVIACMAYLLIVYGLWHQVYAAPRLIVLPAVGYVVSRALSALSIATFPCARDTGLVYMFSTAAAKIAPRVTGLLCAVSCLLLVGWWYPFWGGMAALVCAVYYLYHRRFCVWNFGGNTGDLAGYFLQNLELLILVLAAAGGVVSL